jgi:hypothetical protein
MPIDLSKQQQQQQKKTIASNNAQATNNQYSNSYYDQLQKDPTGFKNIQYSTIQSDPRLNQIYQSVNAPYYKNGQLDQSMVSNYRRSQTDEDYQGPNAQSEDNTPAPTFYDYYQAPLIGGSKKSELEEEDRRQKIMGMQEQEIGKFEQYMPEWQRQMEGSLLSGAKQQIAKGQKSIAENANRRGLLFGGMRQGAQADYAGQVAGQVAQQLPEVQASLEAQHQEMKDKLAQFRLGKYEQDVSEAKSAYQMAMKEYQSNNATFGGLLQVGGMVAANAMFPGSGPLAKAVL